ncbi:MAG: hypothetical protein JRM77_04820 [Nitrososphaerota archaeon]|jgi:hypothetical protein|nr:hypothetical protein [Nitrososphaerota archaeon]
MLGLRRGGFFSRKTLSQMLGYGAVGLVEWGLGYLIFSHLSFMQGYLAFGVQSLVVGLVAFYLRKVWVFRA